jgi:peptidoglycan L-alanyl-D-glutamate endopeptidase CwlK
MSDQIQRGSLNPSDDRSKKNIATLQRQVGEAARGWLAECREQGYCAVIICGTRTFEEQAKIYASGRSIKGPILTKAMPGASMHNYGMAWDFCMFEGVDKHGGIGKAIFDDEILAKCGHIALDRGLDWGGAWKSFKDYPHIQMPGIKLADLRKILPKGWKGVS